MKPWPRGFEIRDATLADVEAIAEVHVEGWETTYRGIVPDYLIASRGLDFRRRNWTERLKRLPAGEFVRVGTLDGEVVAVSSYGVPDEGDPSELGVWRCLYMRQRVQRLGIGSAMRTDMVKIMRTAGYRRLKWWIVDENSITQGFFADSKWTRTGVTREREGGAFHEVELMVDLDELDEPYLDPRQNDTSQDG